MDHTALVYVALSLPVYRMMLHVQEEKDVENKGDSAQDHTQKLPCETLLHIFSFLPLGTVINILPYVCKRFNDVARDASHDTAMRLTSQMPGGFSTDDLRALCRLKSKTCTSLTMTDGLPMSDDTEMPRVLLSFHWMKLTSLTFKGDMAGWDEKALVHALRSGAVASLTHLFLNQYQALKCCNLTGWATPNLSSLTVNTGKRYGEFLRRAPFPRPFDKMKLTYLSISWWGQEVSSDFDWSDVENEDPAFSSPFRSFVIAVLPLSVTSLHLRSDHSIPRTGETFLSPEFKNIQQLSLHLYIRDNPPVLGLGHAGRLRKLSFFPSRSNSRAFKLCAEPYSTLARIEDLAWPLSPKTEDGSGDANEDVWKWCGVPFGRMASLRTVRLNVEKLYTDGSGNCASLFRLPSLEHVSICLAGGTRRDYDKLLQAFGSESFGNVKRLDFDTSTAAGLSHTDLLSSPVIRAFPNLLRLGLSLYMLEGSERAAFGQSLITLCPRLREFALHEVQDQPLPSELQELEIAIRDGLGPSWKSRLTVRVRDVTATKLITMRFYLPTVR